MAKKAEVIITCDATTVKKVLEGINNEIEKTKKRRQELQEKQRTSIGLTKAEEKELQGLIKYENALNERIPKITGEMKKYGEVMKDLAGSKTKDLKKALREVKQQLENMSGNDPNRQKLVNDLKKIQAQIEANTGAIKKNQSAWGALGTTMKNLFSYAGIFAGFNLLKSKMDEAYEANKRFSDSMANVRKVSGLTMDEIGKLANNLSKIDSRTGLGGLMELSYTGAKLGFGNYGIEGLESFAKSAVKVQNALSEDMGADSMTALSKMVEVMGLIPKMGVERAMDATGSAIFKLASTSTATGTNIVEFSKRLMGLANIAHITTPELLAIGSAADSMALMPEVAATAFNKLITAMQKQPNLIENALKIDKGTISDLYQAGKMTDAMVLVFEKMREKGGMNALMQSGVFKDLGSDGARLVAVMATMANRVDMLNAHLAVSRQAFEEGTAVAQEYAIQMDTAAAYSERAANIWEKAFVNPEGVDVVKDFSKAWYEVSKSLTENEKLMFGVKMGLQGILLLLKGIMTILPEILAMVMSGGMWAMIANLRTSEGLLASLTSWFGKLTVAQKAFFKAAGWVGLLLTVYEVGKAFYELSNDVKEANMFMKGFNKTLSDVNKEQIKSIRELDRYRQAIDNANVGTKQRAAAITNFNSKFGPYLKNLLTEKSTALDVAKAYQEVTKQMRAKIALQAKEKDIENQVTPRIQWEAEKLSAYDSSVRGTSRSQYNGTWLKGFVDDARAAGKSIYDIAKELNQQVFHLDQSAFTNVYSQRGKNKVTGRGETTMTDMYGNQRKMNGIITLGENSTERTFQKALNYALQSYSTSNATEAVNRKYKPFEDDINNLKTTEDEPIEPLVPAPDKDAERAAKKAAQERKQALRKEMEDAQKASTGIISKLEEYYRLQEAAINDARADGQLTEEQAKEMVRALSIAKNESLATARRAVTTGKTKDWDELKTKVLPAVMADTSEVSKDLLSTIQQVAVDKLHTDLAKFNGDQKTVMGLDSRAFFDQMNAKAAGNTREAARLKAKLFNNAEKMMKQYSIFDQAVDRMRDDVEQMGFITETYEEFAERMRKGVTEKPDKVLSNGQKLNDKQIYTSMGFKFLGQGTIPYRINIENGEEALEWLRQFGTNAAGEMEAFAEAIPELNTWVSLLREKSELEKLGSEATEQQAARIKEIMEILAPFIPQIQALFYKMDEFANKVPGSIKQQVDAMYSRKPIGIAEMEEQHTGKVDKMTSDYDAKINEARDKGYESTALELEEQKKQALIDLEYQYQQELYQIREQMGPTWQEQYENELATYKNMLDKKLISEKEFQKKKGQLQMQQGLKYGQYYNGLMSNLVDALQDYEIASVEAKYDAQIKAAKENGQDTTALEEKKEEEIYAVRKKYAALSMMVKISEIVMNTAAGIMMAFASLPTPAAIAATALISATGAAQVALAIAEYNKVMSATPSKSKNSGKSTTKLTSGMLTYDEGNVHRYIGQDGRVYTATKELAPKDGLVTHPIATTVQGQPALVAEKGPEIVIGRETTKAIMMNEPELIRYLANYQQQGPRHLYDNGNTAAVADTGAAETADDRQALIRRLDRSDELMRSVLFYLQNPVAPEIAMYDQGSKKGLRTKMKEADQFMSRYE